MYQNAKTTYLFVNKFLKSLPQWGQDGMERPAFHIWSGTGLDQLESGIFHLIDREKKNRTMRLRLYQEMHHIKGTTESAMHTLDYIAFAAKQWIPDEISIQPGEMLIINNGWGIDKISGVMYRRGGCIRAPSS